MSRPAAPPYLTPREQQVAALLRQGRTSKEIATALTLETDTIRTYRKNMMTRYKVSSTVALLATIDNLQPQPKEPALLMSLRYRIARTDDEIDRQLNDAAAWEETGGTAVPGMKYEQGVQAALRWLIGEQSEPPIECLPDTYCPEDPDPA